LRVLDVPAESSLYQQSRQPFRVWSQSDGNVFIQFVDMHRFATVFTTGALLAAVASGVTMAVVSLLRHRTTREDRWFSEGRARKGDCYKNL
jgi:hypothetical protein